MRTLHFNGENWYVDERSWFKRIRQWLIRLSGWEEANGKGWRFRNPYSGKLKDPTPISLFGHMFVAYGWGWDLKLHWTILVWSKSGFYFSPDGTPRKGKFIFKRIRDA